MNAMFIEDLHIKYLCLFVYLFNVFIISTEHKTLYLREPSFSWFLVHCSRFSSLSQPLFARKGRIRLRRNSEWILSKRIVYKMRINRWIHFMNRLPFWTSVAQFTTKNEYKTHFILCIFLHRYDMMNKSKWFKSNVMTKLSIWTKGSASICFIINALSYRLMDSSKYVAEEAIPTSPWRYTTPAGIE